MSDRLTGRTRHRTRNRFLRRPLLVLQVEYRTTVPAGISHREVGRWRDATVEDLADLNRIGPRT